MPAVEFSPDDRWIVASGSSVPVTMWDAASGKKVRAFDHRGWVDWLVFSDDGTRLLTAGSSGAHVWDAGSGELVTDLVREPVTAADMTGDGTLVVTAGPGGDYLWNAATGERIGELGNRIDPIRVDSIRVASFDPTGRRVLTAGEDDVARVWDVASGDLLHVLDGHAEDILDAEFSPDGSSVATASLDGDAALWDVEAGRQVHVLRGHFNPVYAITFDPTGRWIVSGSQRTAGLWPVSSGLLQQYLRGHEEPVTTVEFSSTGWRVLTASEDGTVRTWVCETCGDVSELVELADVRLGATARELSDEERERYLG